MLNDFNDFHFVEKAKESINKQKTIAIQIEANFLNKKAELKKKKEITINKVFDLFPLLGEFLGICNIINIDDINDTLFMKKEGELLKKYILMWDANCDVAENISKYLLKIIFSKENNLRTNITNLLDGLTFGDDRSIMVFKEIIITVIMDQIINSANDYLTDIQIKKNLLKILNKKFEFKVILKIKFINLMDVNDEFKERLIYLIMKYDSNPTGKLFFN